MTARAKTIAVLKVARAVGALAMLGVVVAGTFGFGPEAKIIAAAGTLTLAAVVAKVTHFLA